MGRHVGPLWPDSGMSGFAFGFLAKCRSTLLQNRATPMLGQQVSTTVCVFSISNFEPSVSGNGICVGSQHIPSDIRSQAAADVADLEQRCHANLANHEKIH